MKELSAITHLVHLWFDDKPQLPFEAEVIDYIQETCEIEWHILNMVNETHFTEYEVSKLEIHRFAETLAHFLTIQKLCSMSIVDQTILDNIENEHPREVMDFLYDRLDWVWQKFREKIILPEVFWDPLSDKAESQFDETNSIFRRIQWEEFMWILMEMIERFKWKNVYWITISDSLKDRDSYFQERRQRLEERAIEYFWSDRIIYTWMLDWDLSRFNSLSCDWKYPLDLETWERDYWNADDFVYSENRKVTQSRSDRYRKAFFNSINWLWFSVSSATRNILWWEYIWRCVDAYGWILETYWLQNIWVIPSICLNKNSS